MRFPHYKQLDSMDCGLTCLRMIAKYYGKTYSLHYLRSRSYITREGVSMLGISEAAENVGFRTKGYRLTWEELRDEVPLPCIVHWKQRHFVVVYKISNKRKTSLPVISRIFSGLKNKRSDEQTKVYVADPAAGLLTYKRDEFLRCWIT